MEKPSSTPKQIPVPSEKIIIVKIPSNYTEDQVKTLMGSMGAQFESTGHKVVFAPEEVNVHILG